jgi:low affinity Fe/Cu permease
VTTYLFTMMMLLQNAQADIHMQERIDLARIECGMDQRLQHQLDVKQSALDEAKKRNYDKIAEIARMN